MITTAPAARAAAHALFGTLLLWSSSLSAQNLHIHDASSAAAAKDAKAAFEEAAKGDADVFDLMIANVRALESKTLSELYALNQQTVRTTANRIPAWGWDKLTCDLRTREKDFLEAYRQAWSIQCQAVSSIGTAKEAVEFATKALAAKKDELDKRTKELNQKAPDVKTLRESIDKVRTAITMQPEAPKNLKDR